jgi:TolA-binding protein
LLLAAALGLTGCPNGDRPQGGDGGAEAGGQGDGGKNEPGQGDGDAGGGDAGGGDADEEPLAGSLFTNADLFELYAAEQQGGDVRAAALKKHKLVDGAGKPVPARQAAYERALKAYASGDPEGWAAFLETLGS